MNDILKENIKISHSITSNILTKDIRLNFARKVFGILSAQLVFTFLMCTISILSTSFQTFQNENPFLLGITSILSIFMVILFTCFPRISRMVPINFILLTVFTFAQSYSLSVICSMYEPKLVATAAALTAAITLTLTIFTFISKDYSMSNGIIFIIFGSFVSFLLMCIFSDSQLLLLLAMAFGVMGYGIYIVIDVHMIIEDRKDSIDIDDYILASMIIYLDVINMFIEILKFLEVIAKIMKK